MADTRPYRPNVCVVVRRRRDGRVLMCHRAAFPRGEGWQFPQGGIRPGKSLEEEMRRELREEIGTDAVTIVTVLPAVYRYDFPESVRSRYRGQEQKWVLVDFEGGDEMIHFANSPAEFDEYQWVIPKDAYRNIVRFKKNVYRRALGDLHLI